MNYRQNVKKLYFFIFFHSLIPAYVIERLFWAERGMTVMMVVLCEFIYAVTIMICEIPTGILADKFGRKKLLVVGGFLSMLEMIILLFAHNFWMFGLAIFFAGIASACVSGAFHAILYESLLMDGVERLYEKMVGRLNSIDFTGAILAALSGSVLAKWFGFEFNYILSVGSLFMAFFFTLLLLEPPRTESEKDIDVEKWGFKEYFFQSISFFKDHPKLVRILIQSLAIAACITYLDEFWQLYLDEIGFSVLFFGLFSALISLARIPGNLLAAKLLDVFSVPAIMLGVLLISTLGFIMTAVFPGKIGIVVIILIFLASGVVEPVMSGYVHHRARSEYRATIESVQSLLESAITFGVGIGFGIIATKTTVIVGFGLLGVITSVFLVWTVMSLKHVGV